MTLGHIGLLIDVCNLRAAAGREDWQYSDVLKDVEKHGFNEVVNVLGGWVMHGRASSNRRLKRLDTH